MTQATKRVNIMDLKTGGVVHAYGARFEVGITEVHPERHGGSDGPIMTAKSQWLDGREERGYFGPNRKSWTFQGNKNVEVTIEMGEQK